MIDTKRKISEIDYEELIIHMNNMAEHNVRDGLPSHDSFRIELRHWLWLHDCKSTGLNVDNVIEILKDLDDNLSDIISKAGDLMYFT